MYISNIYAMCCCEGGVLVTLFICTVVLIRTGDGVEA